jgi:type II secretory pathway pseudopilin PulG
MIFSNALQSRNKRLLSPDGETLTPAEALVGSAGLQARVSRRFRDLGTSARVPPADVPNELQRTTGRGAEPPVAPLCQRQREGGFLLLSILLMMALMIIAATIEAPRLVQQMKRDREEEMIHRGTEYARAIKKFYKKFGRYPSNLDQLDNTNQIRFIRKHYKDPLTPDGKWKLLNYGDMQMMLNPNAPGTPAGALGSQGQGSFGQSPQPANGGSVSSAGEGMMPSPALNPGAVTNSPQPVYQSGVSSGGETGGFTTAPPQGNYQPGSSPDSQGAGNPPGGTTFGQNAALGNQTFGGGAIVGVASLSKDPTIRIYNNKKTYNQWQFIYNPQMDQVNVLLRGPYQPMTIGGAQQQIGTPAGQMNQQPGGFGQQPNQPQNFPQQQSPVRQFPPDQNLQ